MNKGQVTLDFLFSFLFYLSFLSIILLAIYYYDASVENNFNNLKEFIELENFARILDFYYSSDSHLSIEIQNEYLIKENIIYGKNHSVFVTTLYSEGGLPGESK